MGKLNDMIIKIDIKNIGRQRSEEEGRR
jgi:hypothetical protein